MMLYLAGIFITFFLAIILLTKKKKIAADYFLSVWLCVIGFHLLCFYTIVSGEIYNFTFLMDISVPLPLFHGPLLYMYSLTMTRDNGFRKGYLLHAVPILIAYLILYSFFTLSVAEKINVYKKEGAGFEIQLGIIFIMTIVSGFLYVFLSFRELNKYKKRIRDEFSDTEKINLNWLRYLTGGILVIWIMVTFSGYDPLVFGTTVIFVLLLGYFGIKQVGIFTYQKQIAQTTIPPATQSLPAGQLQENIIQSQQLAEENTNADVDTVSEADKISLPGEESVIEKPKYESSRLRTDISESIHTALTQLMEQEKIFKEPELSLSLLAKRLDVHPHNLSQVINTYENKNFYDYVNTLRIEEFKKIVTLPGNRPYTLLSLAFECGFNAKTSFNRNFKKLTGQSPSEYLKMVHIDLD